MIAADFAHLLHAKRVGRGRWTAKCPSHDDRTPSLSIAEGKRQPIVFRCMSQQCDQKAILDAMGLTWADILGERAMTPAIRQRIADIGRLEKLEHRFGWIIMGKAVNPDRRLYWLSAEAGIERDIWLLRQRLAVK